VNKRGITLFHGRKGQEGIWKEILLIIIISIVIGAISYALWKILPK